MNAPKVELKNVRTFQGHDGTGLNADIWINGINCMHVYDGAYGGEFEYTENTYQNPKVEQVKANIKLLDDYIATLPEQTSEFGNKTFKIKVNRDIFINDLLAEKEKAKNQKKMVKLMQTCLIFGVPDGDRYSYYDFKRPLSALPLDKLQTRLNVLVMENCKKGVQVLNTNLKEIGLVVN